MALRAFTKVLIKHGRTALDGLLYKGNAPLAKVPKQLPQAAPRLARLVAKPTHLEKEPAVRDWVRHYAWETLAADLRRRAAWQFTSQSRGGAGKAFSEGQRWLLFPAYAFVGLSLTANQTPNVKADEVNQGFHNVTEQIKGIFGPGPKDGAGDLPDGIAGERIDDFQSGHLIARGSRVALYKVDIPKQASTELQVEAQVDQQPLTSDTDPEAPAVLEESVQEAELCDTSVPQAEVAKVTGPQVSLKCKEPLPKDKTSSVSVQFTTSDGKTYQVCLQVSPESSVPVAIDSVAVDGAKLTVDRSMSAPITQETGEQLEELLCEAMKDECHGSPSQEVQMISESFETIPSKKLTQPDVMKDSYVLPQYHSLSESDIRGEKSPSIEVISDPGIASSDLSRSGIDELQIPPPNMRGAGPKLAAREMVSSAIAEEDTSLDSDIVIIDETVELDLQHQELDDPIYLDDLEDDPLSDLAFLDENEAMTYLQHGYEGGYLLMTYFPMQEEMTSLSLPDTGENLWDAYEELFLSCGSTPTKTEIPVQIDTHTPCSKNSTAEVTNISRSPVTEKVESGMPVVKETEHETSTNVEKVASDGVEVAHTRPPDPAQDVVMKRSEYHDAVIVADCDDVPVELISPVLVEKKEDSEFNWENREPTTREVGSHPNVAELPAHLQGVLPLRSEAFDKNKLQVNYYKYTTTLSDHLTSQSPGLLESAVLFTQLADAVAHLDKNTLVYRNMSSEDILLGGDMKWNPLLLADFGGKLYDKGSPRHQSYRDAVVNCSGNCSVVQPEVIPQESEPGYSDNASVLRNLAGLGLEIFGCRSPLATGHPFYMENELHFPSGVPGIFQFLLRALLKPEAHKVLDAKLISSCMHLLLWCPQRYFEEKDPVRAKFLVTRWLTTFSAMTLFKRSSQIKVSAQEELKLQMKCLFLSTLDAEKLSSALDLILANMK